MTVDSNIDMGAYDLKTDDIAESTAAAGVTVDGVNLKDSNIELAASFIKTTNLLIKEDGPNSVAVRDSGDTAYKYLVFDRIYGNDVYENTANTGVTVDGVLLKDSEVTTDVINEKTGASGVTIDSVLLKDGNVDGASLKECNVTTDTPGTPAEGDMKWDGTAHKLQIYNGKAWETVTSAE